ncbi:MAG TPA: hypothetical protein VK138_11950 [Acidiferrobacterales bacterium]|nr:hypothetical protein [Acidiferrobacterales bacterium]
MTETMKCTRTNLLACLLLAAGPLLSASAEAVPGCPIGQEDCWENGREYAGKINNKYAVHMLLRTKADEIKGFMFYESAAIYLRVEGARSGSGEIVTRETDDSGTITGIFQGHLTNESYSGTWSTAKGDRHMPFVLTAVPDSASTVDGSYVCKIAYPKFSQNMTLKAGNGKITDFDVFSAAGPNAHTCDLQLKDLAQERAARYITLQPAGDFFVQSKKLYGDPVEYIRIKDVNDKVVVQFFGGWRLACGLNGYLADVLIDKKSMNCKLLR